MIKKIRGFTLIELLVVISIVSLLSSVILASLNTARAKGRDSERKQNLVQLRNALELYYNDNGHYPIPADPALWYGYSSTTECTQAWYSSGGANYVPGLVPNFISKLPIDPKASVCKLYIYTSNGVDYKLMAHQTIENFKSNDSMADPGWNNCTQPRSNVYSIYSPGGKCW